MLTLVFYAVLTVTCAVAAPTTTTVDLLMPGVQPQKPDTYLCRSFDVANMKPYITGFTPNADMEIAHHILLYGCEEPGREQEVWNCGEMATTSTDYETGPVCAEGAQKILYAWAMDAPSLSLPKDVAFRLGRETGIQKLAMQVHYKNVTSFLPPYNKKDSSGLTLTTTDEPKGRLAGVYLMVTDGVIPSKQIEYLETACPFLDTEVEINPFAFRTHTHPLGRVVSGYRVRDGQWTEIGRHDPRKPQMFYNVTTPNLTVKRGDILVARCTMENNLDHDVAIGSTQKDEMCNFYIMYYVEGNKQLQNGVCFSQGGPNWYLKDYPDQGALNLLAMPDTASIIPGTDTPLLPTTMGALQEVQEILAGRQMEQEEEGEGEDDNPAMDDLLDRYLSRLAPEEMDDLVNEVMQDQQQPYPSRGYGSGPYYYPEDESL